MLGAVRHKGFIPWDDDIDLMMLREEYEKLCEVAPFEFKHPYFFQTEATDPGSLRGHVQLRNSQTTCLIGGGIEAECSFNQGIFIDIFPLDAAPDDQEVYLRHRMKTVSYLWQAKLNAFYPSRYRPARTPLLKPVKSVMHFILNGWPGKLIGFNNYYQKFEREAQRYNGTSARQVTKYCIAGPDNADEVWDKNLFSDSFTAHFEFLDIPIPVGYRQILNILYGDWRIPINLPSLQGDIIFDTDKAFVKRT